MKRMKREATKRKLTGVEVFCREDFDIDWTVGCAIKIAFEPL
jgi:hypothetical protein